MKRFFPLGDKDPNSKAKNKKQLAEEMGFSLRTFQRRLKDADLEIPRGLICPEKQREIGEKLGWQDAW